LDEAPEKWGQHFSTGALKQNFGKHMLKHSDGWASPWKLAPVLSKPDQNILSEPLDVMVFNRGFVRR
jgi:hypothetical protein